MFAFTHKCCPLRGLLTAQKYPAKNIWPDCPAQEQKNLSFPLYVLYSLGDHADTTVLFYN